MKYGEGIYRIICSARGWCVAKMTGRYDDGTPRWHAVSNYYAFRGWAQNYARKMKISVQNYESIYA